MVYKLYLLKISNFIHEIQMNERIILIDLCENDLMNKCWSFYKLSAFFHFIEDGVIAFEIVYNNDTNEVEIYMYIQSVYWYNDWENGKVDEIVDLSSSFACH